MIYKQAINMLLFQILGVIMQVHVGIRFEPFDDILLFRM